MYELRFTTAFKKSYRQMKKRGLDMKRLDDAVERLQRGESLPESYRDHSLSGEYSGFRECHIRPDWLLIYLIENDILTLTLVDTGTHADLFKR